MNRRLIVSLAVIALMLSATAAPATVQGSGEFAAGARHRVEKRGHHDHDRDHRHHRHDCRGQKGDRGPRGPAGPAGPAGEPGLPGAPGASAEDLLGMPVETYLDQKVNGYVQGLGPAAVYPWDWSQTRADGFHVFTPQGLFVATSEVPSVPSPDSRKVAAYLDVDDFGLGLLNGSSLAYAQLGGTFAFEPGLQAVVDLNGDTTPDGILVGEEVYGGNWWLAGIAPGFDTSTAPTVGGGGGPFNGSIAQWMAGYPSGQVLVIGFSLGSGVYSIGYITEFIIGGVTYDFTA